MRFLAALALLAGFWVALPETAQAQYAPTTPQVPMPQVDVGRAPPVTPPTPSNELAGTCNNPGGDCQKKNCVQKLIAWVTYRPSSGNALPCFRVPPYTSPYTGIFVCTTVPGPACAGNCNSSKCKSSDGKKGSCTNSLPPSSVEPVAPRFNAGVEPMSPMPMATQGFPARGCQGGSLQLSDPSFPGSGQKLLENAEKNKSEEGTVENVEFKPVIIQSSYSANVSQTEFIAAALVTRQFLKPTELFLRPNMNP